MREFNFTAKRRRKKRFLIIALLIVVSLLLYSYITFKSLSTKGKVLIASARELKTAFSENDIDLLNKKVLDFSGKYNDFRKSAQSVYWAAFIPYIADFKNGVEAGEYLVQAGQESIKAITPYADLIGFKRSEGRRVGKEGR